MSILRTLAILACITVLAAFFSKGARAETVLVAVAGNFTAASQAIAKQFHKDTGHTVKLSFGSTGKIYSRIRQGAPYDVFLAADSKRPQLAESEGFAVPGSRMTYALGSLVLYGNADDLATAGKARLRAAQMTKLALTNPRTAPYGAAAVEVLQGLQVYDSLKPKLVEGSTVLQTLQFVSSGNAELGFVAKSQVLSLKQGTYWDIPASLYTPLKQEAVLLKSGADNPAAVAFMAYLASDATKATLTAFGYGLP